MDKAIQEWLDAREDLKNAYAAVDMALEQASTLRSKNFNLRQARAEDIFVGQIVWYPEFEEDDDDRPWRRVEVVLYPGDDWKAFSADLDAAMASTALT